MKDEVKFVVIDADGDVASANSVIDVRETSDVVHDDVQETSDVAHDEETSDVGHDVQETSDVAHDVQETSDVAHDEATSHDDIKQNDDGQSVHLNRAVAISIDVANVHT